MIRCVLLEAGLLHNFWAEALNHVVYVHNRLLSKANGSETPYKHWVNKEGSDEHVHEFGCLAYVLVPSNQCSKLGPQSQPAIYLGPVD